MLKPRRWQTPHKFGRLQIVLLGWNNATREDFLKTPNQLIYGTSTRLPVDFFLNIQQLQQLIPRSQEITNKSLTFIDPIPLNIQIGTRCLSSLDLVKRSMGQ